MKKKAPTPWECPATADWITGFLARHRVVGKVRKAMKAKDDPDLPRMAAWMVQGLGRPGAWPGGALRADIEGAIAGLERVLADDYGSEEINDAIRTEIQALRRRLAEQDR